MPDGHLAKSQDRKKNGPEIKRISQVLNFVAPFILTFLGERTSFFRVKNTFFESPDPNPPLVKSDIYLYCTSKSPLLTPKKKNMIDLHEAPRNPTPVAHAAGRSRQFLRSSSRIKWILDEGWGPDFLSEDYEEIREISWFVFFSRIKMFSDLFRMFSVFPVHKTLTNHLFSMISGQILL